MTMSAKDVLERARSRAATRDLPSEEALAELEELLRLRDAGEPILVSDALELLASHGWRRARSAFDKLLRDQYGRKWSGK